MSNDVPVGTVEDLSTGIEAVVAGGQPATAASETESRELWRVVSMDGSTRIFQTKPALEPTGKRMGLRRRAVPCTLPPTAASAAGLFEQSPAHLPTLVAEGEASLATTADAELSVELTSVTQAWPSLSPGIRGAVMALIRAASKPRPTRPGAAPRRE